MKCGSRSALSTGYRSHGLWVWVPLESRVFLSLIKLGLQPGTSAYLTLLLPENWQICQLYSMHFYNPPGWPRARPLGLIIWGKWMTWCALSSSHAIFLNSFRFLGARSLSLPLPPNEPATNLTKGSPELDRVKQEFQRVASQTLEIPCIVNGKEFFTGNTKPQLAVSSLSFSVA